MSTSKEKKIRCCVRLGKGPVSKLKRKGYFKNFVEVCKSVSSEAASNSWNDRSLSQACYIMSHTLLSMLDLNSLTNMLNQTGLVEVGRI